jgi:hypothetical protein
MKNELTMLKSGRSRTALEDVNIDKTEQMLKKDRPLSLKEMSGSANISPERIHHIIMVELGMSQVHAKQVHQDLSDE